MKKKVLVIGLDGATFDLIIPWVKEGRLKNLEQFIDEGIHGDLESTIHPLSPIAWTSFMTGKNPGKHGIYGFTERAKGSYGIHFTNGGSCKCKTLWRMVSEGNKSVGVIDVPMTYPPEEVNGFIISGMDSLWEERRLTYPVTLLKEIEENVGKYVWYPQKPDMQTMDIYLEGIFKAIENRLRVSKYLIKNKEWDLFMTVFLAPDRVQHTLWRHMDGTHPLHDIKEAEKYRHVIRDVYMKIDDAIGELLDECGDDATVLIMSDHGSGPYKKVVNLSKWLEMKGYLRFKNNDSHGIGDLSRRVSFSISKNVFFKLKKSLPTHIRKKFSNMMPRFKEKFYSNLYFSNVDWKHTTAYASGNYGNIFINLKGREPDGIVKTGAEFEELKDRIISDLSQIRDDETGESILGNVYTKEEIYEGDFVQNAPDLIVEWKDFAYYTRQNLVSEEVSLFEQAGTFGSRQIEHSACHRMEGIFLAKGKGIRKGEKVADSRIIDLAPTILYLLDLPVPRDMDGRVLARIFEKDYMDKHGIEYREGEGTFASSRTNGYSEKDTKVIEEQLKGLGYFG